MSRAKDDLDRHITGGYGEGQHATKPQKQRGFDRYKWMEPDVAGDDPPEYPDGYDEHLLDKEIDDETV